MKDPGTERNVQILLVYSTLVHLKRFTPQTPHQLAKMLTTNHNNAFASLCVFAEQQPVLGFFFFFEVNQSNTDKKNLKSKLKKKSLEILLQWFQDRIVLSLDHNLSFGNMKYPMTGQACRQKFKL